MRQNFNEIQAFIMVAREKNFTRAAAKLGITQSALSQTISNLETRLQVRLLTRTTRSLSLTVAGEQLLNNAGQHFDAIEQEINALVDLRKEPAGRVRISCGDFVLNHILLPKLTPLIKKYPEIKIEFNVNYGLVDIVAERFDAGIRFGETLHKDMIAVPIGADTSMAAVATQNYFDKYGKPKKPSDLLEHNCINLRLPTYGGIYSWEFEQEGREINIHVNGQLTFNTTHHMVAAALDSLGIAFLPEEEFSPYLENGSLIRVLEDWCPPFSGYHIYYPTKRQPSQAFSLVLEALKIKKR